MFVRNTVCKTINILLCPKFRCKHVSNFFSSLGSIKYFLRSLLKFTERRIIYAFVIFNAKDNVHIGSTTLLCSGEPLSCSRVMLMGYRRVRAPGKNHPEHDGVLK